MKIAYRIMACYERQHYVEDILRKLDGTDVKVFWDDRPKEERKGTAYTQLKCIEDALNGDYTHLCLLQDDIALVDRFDDCIKRLVEFKPMALWTLFCPYVKAEDLSFDAPYAMIQPANTWGQGNVIEAGMLRKIMEFRQEKMPNYIYDDALYLIYCNLKGIPTYTTRVAMLQHLCPTNSMLGYNNQKKVSKVWIGENVYERMNWENRSIKRYNTGSQKKTIEREMLKYGPKG